MTGLNLMQRLQAFVSVNFSSGAVQHPFKICLRNYQNVNNELKLAATSVGVHGTAEREH